MSQMRIIKLKLENIKQNKKIIFPSTYNELIEKINSFKPNTDPNKIFQIVDIKNNKIIQNQNDFQIFNLQHFSEKTTTLLINLIDKNKINIIPEYQLENSSLFFQSIIVPKKQEEIIEEKNEIIEEIIEEKKELTEEEKMKESIRLLVRSKLKIFEDNIMNELIENIQPLPIHKGIKCDECGIKDIKGVRYKCTTCLNYNLCEKCEENTEHDENHIFIKINEPIPSENELNRKINESMIKFSKINKNENINNIDNDNNKNYDYIVEPTVFYFKKDNLLNYQKIVLKNNGNMIWKKGFVFKFIKEKKNINGNDHLFMNDFIPGNSIEIELIFDLENVNVNEFYVSYKLIDDKSNQLGNIQKFKINFE